MEKESDKSLKKQKNLSSEYSKKTERSVQDEFKEIFRNMPDAGLESLLDSARDLNSLVGYIQDCKPEVKEEISTEFISHIEKVSQIYLEFEPQDPVSENHIVLSNMDLEISHLKESIKDFSRNKIQLSEFFEIIFYCNASIADNLEAYELPESIHKLIVTCLKELRWIELKVLQLKKLSY